MKCHDLPPVSTPLVDYLDALSGRAPLVELTARLRASPVTPDDLRDYVRFDPHRYVRTLVSDGPWYSLLLLCWRSGQRSTIHNHAESSCAFRVLAGVCTETLYRLSPCGQVVPVQTEELSADEVIAAEYPKVHQVSNLQAAGQDMVTLHVYTPPLKALKTFSIMGEGLALDWAGNGDRWLPDETKALPPPTGPVLDEALFEVVLRFMRANLKHDIQVADFAKRTGHSKGHFSFLFKNRTDCSPFHYLKEFRMREAHRLIVAGERDIATVALAVGYTHRRHFSEVFRRYWGYSVQELMARVRNATVDHRP